MISRWVVERINAFRGCGYRGIMRGNQIILFLTLSSLINSKKLQKSSSFKFQYQILTNMLKIVVLGFVHTKKPRINYVIYCEDDVFLCLLLYPTEFGPILPNLKLLLRIETFSIVQRNPLESIGFGAMKIVF